MVCRDCARGDRHIPFLESQNPHARFCGVPLIVHVTDKAARPDPMVEKHVTWENNCAWLYVWTQAGLKAG